MEKPFAPACERNQGPILDVLKSYLTEGDVKVLELGSGTGQHAVYFAQFLANVTWQPSELVENLAGINAWLSEYPRANVLAPVALDVSSPIDPLHHPASVDAVFTANTLHYVSETIARGFIRVASHRLAPGGRFIVYGPFNDAGRFTSEGNAGLDRWLKHRNPESGLKDVQWLTRASSEFGFDVHKQHDLPANNLLLIYEKKH